MENFGTVGRILTRGGFQDDKILGPMGIESPAIPIV